MRRIESPITADNYTIFVGVSTLRPMFDFRETRILLPVSIQKNVPGIDIIIYRDAPYYDQNSLFSAYVKIIITHGKDHTKAASYRPIYCQQCLNFLSSQNQITLNLASEKTHTIEQISANHKKSIRREEVLHLYFYARFSSVRKSLTLRFDT